MACLKPHSNVGGRWVTGTQSSRLLGHHPTQVSLSPTGLEGGNVTLRLKLNSYYNCSEQRSAGPSPLDSHFLDSSQGDLVSSPAALDFSLTFKATGTH